jgi:hypothetical protein
LRGFCVDRGDLAEAFYTARLRGVLFEPPAEAKPAEAAPKPAPGLSFADLVLGTAGKSAPPAGKLAAASNHSDGFARVAMQLWSSTIHEACNDQAFAEAVGVSAKSLRDIGNELLATARRKNLERQISAAIANVAHIETAEQKAAKATIVADRLINQFVASLGVEPEARPLTFDATGIGETPINFRDQFAIGWLRSWHEQVLINARSSDGLVHDAEQNARLGQILASINVAL